jgi:hypothetical protein
MISATVKIIYTMLIPFIIVYADIYFCLKFIVPTS